MHLRQRQHRRRHPRAGRQATPGGTRRRASAGRLKSVYGPVGDRCADRTRGQGEGAGIPALRQRRSGHCALLSSTGLDLSQFSLDQPIQSGPTRAIESVSKAYSGWTRRRLLEQHAMGGRYSLIVGSPSQVADELLKWIDQTGIDGFNLTCILNPQSYIDFIELVVRSCNSAGATRPNISRERCVTSCSTTIDCRHVIRRRVFAVVLISKIKRSAYLSPQPRNTYS